MLQEELHVRQAPNDYVRRLFSDQDFDLCIWYKPMGTFYGFQLCYDLSDQAKALTWREDRGFSHHIIDTGEESPLANRSPILKTSCHFDAVEITARFCASDGNLPAEIREYIRGKLKAYEPKS